jgi:hypothetical protein
MDKGKPKSRREVDRKIDDQVEDSFPASDPPSYTAPKRVGRPQRKREMPPEEKKRPVESR